MIMLLNSNPERWCSTILLLVLLAGCSLGQSSGPSFKDARFEIYSIHPAQTSLQFFWKNDAGEILGSLGNLKAHLYRKGKTLLFAMNGGMYQANQVPLGLYVENKRRLSRLNTRSGDGNFYLKPNGIFYLTKDKKAFIKTTADMGLTKNIEFATQSGPMLVIKGQIHSAFKKNSSHLNIRNGVGILPDGRVLFAISNTEVSLYDFAEFL